MQKQQSSKTYEEKKEDRVKNTIRMQKERSAKTDEKKKEDCLKEISAQTLCRLVKQQKPKDAVKSQNKRKNERLFRAIKKLKSCKQLLSREKEMYRKQYQRSQKRDQSLSEINKVWRQDIKVTGIKQLEDSESKILARREKDRMRKRKSREKLHVKEQEKVYKKYRQSQKGMEKVRLRDKERQHRKRQDTLARKAEQQKDSLRRSNKRQDKKVRKTEQNKDSCRRHNTREDPQVKKTENDKNKKRMQKTRQDPQVKKEKNNKNKKRMQKIRQNPLVKKTENDKNKKRMQKTRQDPQARTTEQQADTERRRHQRTNPMQRRREQITDTQQKKRKREDSCERERERLVKQQKRRDESYRRRENLNNKVTKRIRRSVPVTNAIDDLIKHFHNAIKTSCEYECTCCGQLFFRHSVISSPTLNISDKLRKQCIQKKDPKDIWLCHTCCTYLKNGKVPPLSKANGMCFPPKPEQLNLNALEERLVAPVNVFMQLRELPSGRQASIHGNVVNVPADNLSTVQRLPRRLNESDTIPIKLKRRLRYRSHYLYENVRPQKCVDATKFLLRKKLFQQHVPNGLYENWITQSVTDLQNTEWNSVISNVEPESATSSSTENGKNCDTENLMGASDEQNNHSERNVNTPKSKTSQSETEDADQWSEDDDGNEQGAYRELDTMLQPEVADLDGQHNFNVAPSEGNIPVSIFSEDIEELAFPGIFCGERRPNNRERITPVRYSDLCKSELRRSDRRAAASVANIFFKARKLQLKQIQDKVWLSMRRNKTKGKTYTAKDVKDKDNVAKMVKLDEGYRIFRTLRGSPPYWESAKKDIFAMIRQLGLPTWVH